MGIKGLKSFLLAKNSVSQKGLEQGGKVNLATCQKFFGYPKKIEEGKTGLKFA